MTGAGELPTIDYKALCEKVNANRNRLDACPRHHFPQFSITPRVLGQKATCAVCGGEMDLVQLNYYVRGYEAAGKSGNDIVPGWKEEPGNDEPPKRAYFKPPE